MTIVKKIIMAGSVISAFFLASPAASACSLAKAPSHDALFSADIIVRAIANKYIKGPDPMIRTTGIPESLVEFEVDEILKGIDVPKTLILNAYLSTEDDYNDQKPPYTFVRPNGRSGSCYANTYKQGASFLLFLKVTDGGYTSNISALGPTNEQLHDTDDPWLLWTREEIKKRGKK